MSLKNLKFLKCSIDILRAAVSFIQKISFLSPCICIKAYPNALNFMGQEITFTTQTMATTSKELSVTRIIK